MSKNWHYAKGGEKHGPVTAAQLKELAKNGQLASDDLVWREDMKEWRKAGTVKGLLPEQPQPSAASSPPPVVKRKSPDDAPSIWEHPAVIALLFLLFWPLGVYLLWKKQAGNTGSSTNPRISKKWVVIGACVVGIMVIGGIFLTVTQTSAARKEIAEAATLWEQGKHTEAVAIYQSVITERGPFIPDDQESLAYGRVIDQLAQEGREQEAKQILEKLNRLSSSSSVIPLVETEAGRQLLADIRREQEAERQRLEEDRRKQEEQEALARAASNPITLDKSERADFLDNTADYKGKAVRFECEWIGGGLRSRSTGRMTVLELDVYHGSGLFNVNVRVPEELEIPNIQKADDLVVTFLCEQGKLNTGNKALKIERR
ncbi:MAG: GYF domain-containing protein [Zavarzinella sp.]